MPSPLILEAWLVVWLQSTEPRLARLPHTDSTTVVAFQSVKMTSMRRPGSTVLGVTVSRGPLVLPAVTSDARPVAASAPGRPASGPRPEGRARTTTSTQATARKARRITRPGPTGTRGAGGCTAGAATTDR